ncbi:MAG: hypothetical protein GEU73_14640 [Chloroflexi bacterium]|nr:hypothetical protein [Chloroflexota bacterium]
MDSVLYIGTDHGVVTLQSPDGRSWREEHRGLQGWEVPKVAVDPEAPNCVWAGTRGDGVWLSEDAGESWRKPSYGKRGPGKVRAVTVDSGNDRIYAGCEPIDVFVSEDRGRNWTRLDGVWDVPFVATVTYPVATVEPHVRDIAVDPNDPDTIYAALQVGYIVRSTDGGETWKLLDGAFDCDVHTIAIDPTNRDHVVLATGGHDARQGRAPGKALYASDDRGATWRPAAMNFMQEYSVPLVMHPRDPRILYSALAHGQPSQWRRPTGAESTIIRSTDGGQQWQQLDSGLGEATKDFPEVLILDREQPDRVYAAYRQGQIYASEDGGESWAPLELRVSGIADAKLAHV